MALEIILITSRLVHPWCYQYYCCSYKIV